MKLNVSNWNDITIKQYNDIVNVNEDNSLSEVEKDLKIIAILCNVDEEEIWNLSVNDAKDLRKVVHNLGNFTFPKTLKSKTMTIGRYECKVDVNLEKMSIAQYIDFQEYFKDINANMAQLMSVFLVPKGCKYNDGYDINDLVSEIFNNMSIIDYNTVLFFFLKKYQNSTNNILNYLVWTLRMKTMFMRRKNPLRMKYKELSKKIISLKALLGSTLLKR